MVDAKIWDVSIGDLRKTLLQKLSVECEEVVEPEAQAIAACLQNPGYLHPT